MNGDKAVTATFNKQKVTLTVSVAGAGSGTVVPTAGPHIYDYGDVVSLTATPGTGSTFGGWSGDVTDPNESSSITMNGDKAVTATFDLACEYLVSTSFKLIWYAVGANNNGKIKYTTSTDPVLNIPTFNGTLTESHKAGEITVGVNLTAPYYIGSSTLIVTLEAVPDQVQTQGLFDVRVLLNGVLFVTVPFDAQGTAGDRFEITFVPADTVMTNNCGESMVIDVTDVAEVEVIN